MIALKHRLHLTVLALAFASTGLASPAAAETLKVPKDKPEFTMDLPDGWSHETDQAGFLSCTTAPRR